MKSAIAAILTLLLVACADYPQQQLRAQNLVGLWEERSPTVSAITLRRADGTYRCKEIQQYDYAKPPVTYECRGHWSVNGKEYILNLEYVSTPVWQKDVGKQWKVTILESTQQLLKYLSPDGALVEERKIGEAADALFERSTLSPLPANQSSG